MIETKKKNNNSNDNFQDKWDPIIKRNLKCQITLEDTFRCTFCVNKTNVCDTENKNNGKNKCWTKL